MIKYFYRNLQSPTITELEQSKRGVWIHSENPSQQEIDTLTSKFKLEIGHIEDALDEDEMPRLEREGKQSYIFVRYPFQTSDGDMDTAPLLVVIDDDNVLTVSQRPLKSVERFTRGKDAVVTTQRTKLLLLILADISQAYDNSIRITSRKIKQIRTRLRNQKLTNQDLIDFVILEDELNEFLASLLPNNATLRRLLAGRHISLFEADQDIVEDLLLINDQSIEAIRANLRSIDNIRNAHTAISSNNLNKTITFLTLATIMVALPNVFFGMYGMNVSLPFQQAHWVFIALIGINLTLISIIMGFAKKKNLI
jgi:magnesium transporter